MTERLRPATTIVTGKCRASFVQILQPKANDDGKLKYSVCLLIPKSDTKTLADIKRAIEAAKKSYATKFGGGVVPSELKIPMRDGDKELAEGVKKGDEYKGHYFLNASGTQKPGLVDREGKTILNPTNDDIYSGMYVRCELNFYPYSNKSRGIAAGLNHVQKTNDGEPLAGRGNAENAFDRYEDNEPTEEPVTF